MRGAAEATESNRIYKISVFISLCIAAVSERNGWFKFGVHFIIT